MPKYVQIGSDVVEFPDNMSDAQIAQVIQRQQAERKRLLAMPYSEVVEGTEGIPSQEPTQMGPAGRRAVGLIKGAFVDPLEAVAQIVGGEAGRRGVAERETAYQAARQARGETGIEVSRLLGAAVSPAGLIPGVRAAQLVGTGTRTARIVGGAAGGAASAIAQPVSNASEDLTSFATEKIQQLGLGAVLGGFISGGVEGIRGGANLIKNLTKPLSESGRQQMIREFVDNISGADKDKFVQALNQAEELVPGSQPTAAEVLSQFPTSVNIAAAQERLARTTGGAPIFAQRAAEQQAARLSQLGDETAIGPMEALRAAETAPMRQEALAQANIAGRIVPQLEADIAAREASRIQALQTQGQFQARAAEQGVLAQGNFLPVPGLPRAPSRYSPNIDRTSEAIDAAKDAGNIVLQRAAERDFKQLQLQSLADEGFFPLKVNDIVDRIDTIQVSPGQRSSEVVQNTFNALRVKLTDPSYVKSNGIIDSRDLYTIRKEIGNDIRRFAKDAANWDQKLTAGLEKNIKSYIDNSIEKAGGIGWKDYLNKYADYSTKINQMAIGRELAKSLNSPLNAERAGAFAQALVNAPRTITRAGGGQRFETLGEAVTPQQIAAANSILADLQRATKADELAKSARDLGLDVAEAEIPQLLNQTVAITNAILRKLRSTKVEDLNREAAQLFADPRQLGIFMSSVPKTKVEKLVSAIFPRISDTNQQSLINFVNQAIDAAGTVSEQVAIKAPMQPQE
jgi:hypothetical protein